MKKLKSLPNAEQYLKPGISFKILDQQVLAISDLQAAQAMKKARIELFRQIFKAGGGTDLINANEGCG